MGTATVGNDAIATAVGIVRTEAEAAGRDPAAIGLQMMLAPPPTRAEDKDWYADHDRVVRRAEELANLGFDWVSLNATAIFQAGARSVGAMLDELAALHARIHATLG
jgi:hypothetical protein